MPPIHHSQEQDAGEATRLGYIAIATLFTLSILCLSLGWLIDG